MHLCAASPDGGPRLTAARHYRAILLVALSACCLAAGCDRPARAAGLTFDWTLMPQPAVVGPATITLRVKDGSGGAVHGAHLRIEAQMAHPGMATLMAATQEESAGVYKAGLELTMAGDWILLIAGSLANGDLVEHRIDVPHVQAAGARDVPP